MRLRIIKVGCFGGGTGLPSVLGGLKRNPWIDLNAIVTMFDSGGSSGQLRDELGVLPPGDILKCALTLARNEREARRVLLSRLPTLEDSRLAGHTGGNLLLSMMERYSGNFMAAVEGLRSLLGCKGRVWPVSIDQASLCARYADGHVTKGENQIDARQTAGHVIQDIWLEPEVSIHAQVAAAVQDLDAVVIGPGSFYTSLLPVLAVQGMAEALAPVPGPIVLVANLLTEGRGMDGFTAADEVSRIESFIKRRVDAVVFNEGRPSADVLARYGAEHKRPLELGSLPDHCRLVSGTFWRRDIARHDRPRLGHALWAVLAGSLGAARPREAGEAVTTHG
ncbi:MAG: YvcK family protein [Acidobacteria bacterium]|nr:YvcK family protein [Acidobacteriota bacterium]